MADDGSIRISSRLIIPAAELTWRFSPSGGPGGQHANTSNTRAEVTWRIDDSVVVSEEQRRRLTDALGATLAVAADDTRSQTRNRDLARNRLAERVTAALHVPTKRKDTKPSRRARQRRLDEKRRRGQTKAGRSKPRYDE